jgi:ferredoxin
MTDHELLEDKAMHVSIAPDGCHGHGLCDAEAPAFFTFDDSGYNVTPRCSVPEAHLAAVRAAAANCPERAILLSDGDGDGD